MTAKETKHTPRPWEAIFDPDWYPWPESIEILGPNGTIAWMTANAKYRDRDEADACLITSSPDMLDALRQWKLAEDNGDQDELANARKARDHILTVLSGVVVS